MLGAAFDPQRMSSDDPLAGRRRRGDLSVDHGLEDAALDSFYSVTDGTALSGQSVGQTLVSDLEELKDNEEEMEEDWMINEVMGRGTEGDMKEVKREDIMEEEEHKQLYRQRTDSGSDQRKPPTNTQPPYHNMKRRKKRQTNTDDSDTSDMTDLATRDKKNSSSRTDPLLPLRLLLAGRNRALRRKLKKEFRKKARKLGRKPPPWTCTISRRWGRLKEGFFPRYLLDGRCLSDRCFYRLYDCVPQRYRIKLLQRDPNYCNPLPAVAANSTYEQSWTVVRYHVTVGCSCESADPLRKPLPLQGQIRRP